MKKLQNILYQKEFNRDMSAISSDRKFQVRGFKATLKNTTKTNTALSTGGKHESK